MKLSMRQIVSSLPAPAPLSDLFYCPITIDLMHVAIVHWIKHNGDSPLSRTPLVVDDLYPHMAVLGVIQEQAKQDRSPFYFVVLADIVYHPHTSTRRRDGPG